MNGHVGTPTVRDVLWEAQRGVCWCCGAKMLRKGEQKLSATIDHVWPKAMYGNIGDILVTLLACKGCNNSRICRRPTDDEIREVIRIWRLIPLWWMRKTLAAEVRQALAAERAFIRADIITALVPELSA